ncbi:transposase [Oleomonas cavernae]|uniref:transposase n=1 Tax=Oleomonas cavernae TaxID=2320859 RepID=UPI00131478EF|nr:transposase [Oleomonas cavernae]
MLATRRLDSGIPCAWVLAEALYGSDYRFRNMLEDRRQPYVLAIRSDHTLRLLTEQGLLQTDPKEMDNPQGRHSQRNQETAALTGTLGLSALPGRQRKCSFVL